MGCGTTGDHGPPFLLRLCSPPLGPPRVAAFVKFPLDLVCFLLLQPFRTNKYPGLSCSTSFFFAFISRLDSFIIIIITKAHLAHCLLRSHRSARGRYRFHMYFRQIPPKEDIAMAFFGASGERRGKGGGEEVVGLSILDGILSFRYSL